MDKSASEQSKEADNPKEVLKIISISEDGTHFEVDEDNLKIIMSRVQELEKTAKKMVIISVVGAFRTGKSFLLSSFIRYLEYCESTGIEIPKTEPGNAEWLKSSDHLSHGSTETGKSSPGFKWRGGHKRTTTGMSVYGQPFVRTLPGTDEKTIVLLLDTQGMFDMEASKAMTGAIFGLSTLISSYQIFNVKMQIQENVLDELDFFSQLSLAALRGLDGDTNKNPEGKEPEKQELEMYPFQTIEFLIRDFPHFDDISNIPQCLSEMGPYLKKILSSRTHDEGMRDRIKQTFQNIECFILSHPGMKMASADWTGNLNVVEEPFIKLLDHYVRRVFEKNMVAKEMQGRTITSSSFSHYITAYVNVFKDGKVPEAMSLVQAIGDATNVTAKEEALRLYTIEMNKICGTSFVNQDELKKAHEKALKKVTNKFDVDAVLGNIESIKKVRVSLLESAKVKFKNYIEANKTKVHANMEKYIIPVIAAIFAYFLDWASDFLCDGWLESCRKLSTFLFLGYFIVFLILLLELFRVYQKSGTATAGIAALTFGRATLEKARDINDDKVKPTIGKLKKIASRRFDINGDALKQKINLTKKNQ